MSKTWCIKCGKCTYDGMEEYSYQPCNCKMEKQIDLEVETISDDNTTTMDWRNMTLLKRIEVGVKLIFFGKIKIYWKKNTFYSRSHGKVTE